MRPAVITLALLVFAALPGAAVEAEDSPAETDRGVLEERSETVGQASSPIEPGSPAAGKAIPQPAAGPRLSDDEIQELDVIRRRLQISPLQGALWSAESAGGPGQPDTDFAGQLRKDFGDRQGEPGTGGLRAPRSNQGTADQRRVAALRQFSLRSLSRRLDTIALDMEELRLYDEADRVRELSRQLRQQSAHPVD